MKRNFVGILLVLMAATAVFLSGCGGGGGGGTTTGTTGVTLSNVRVEGYLSGTSTQVDLQSLVAGDSVDLRLVGFDSSNTKMTISGATFAATAPSSIVSITGGTLRALASTAGINYTVNGTSSSNSGSSNLQVIGSGGAIVTGLIRNVNGDGVYKTIVNFYNASNVLVGVTRTVSNGTFRAGMPATATRFTIDLSEADPANSAGTTRYFRTFGYGSLDYTTTGVSCLAKLPTLVVGNNALPNSIVLTLYSSASPPPPPTGCF